MVAVVLIIDSGVVRVLESFIILVFLSIKKRVTDQPTDGRTDRPTDGRTDPLIEMRGRILKRRPRANNGEHILGSQNVYSRAEGIADRYWSWAVFFYLFFSLFLLQGPKYPVLALVVFWLTQKPVSENFSYSAFIISASWRFGRGRDGQTNKWTCIECSCDVNIYLRIHKGINNPLLRRSCHPSLFRSISTSNKCVGETEEHDAYEFGHADISEGSQFNMINLRLMNIFLKKKHLS